MHRLDRARGAAEILARQLELTPEAGNERMLLYDFVPASVL